MEGAAKPCKAAIMDSMTVHFDGVPVPARAGQTVAAALIAAGHPALRRTASGAPRGVWCGMGACFDCIMTIDGQPGQRACMTATREGMRIGDGSPVPAVKPSPETPLNPAVLVVGGGPAGLSAAAAAAEAGAEVLLLDECDVLGGQYFKPALRRDARARQGERLRARARDAGVRIVQAAVWAACPGPELAATAGESRLVVRPRRLVIAAGAHEAAMPLPGWTLPGCMTTGAMQTLARSHGVRPGQRVAIAGNGPLNLQLALELVRLGVQVAAVVEAAREPGVQAMRLARHSPGLALAGLRMLASLRRAGVPVLWGMRAVAAEGEERFRALRIAGQRGERVITADACALHWGFQAETGLARALGVRHRVVRGRLETVTDAQARTSDASVFAVGDGARAMGAQVALYRGTLAGLTAARDLGFSARRGPFARLRRAERFQGELWRLFAADTPDPGLLADETMICRCEEVSAGAVRKAMAEGLRSAASVKRATRAGMGRCSGRFCGEAIARLCGATTEAGFAAPRAPLRPVLAGAVMADRPEPEDAAVMLPALSRWVTAPPGACPRDADVVVIGGGIIGLACALYLAREGVDVLLLDRGEPGLGASTANAGSLHVQLVPYVYAEGTGGPLGEALPLGPASIALWRELAREAGENLGLRTDGGIILAETQAEMALLRSKAAFERGRGVPTEVVGMGELRRIAPNLDRRFVGGAFCPLEGQGDPLRGTIALLGLARRAGARVAGGVEVTGLAADGAGWRVTAGAGMVRCGQVVNAAGVQAGRVGALAGARVPVHALVQQVIATDSAPPLLRHLVAWTGRHLSLKQGNGGHLLIGGGWPGSMDGNGSAQVLRGSFEGNLALAARALPGLAGVHVLRAWTGLAPHLPRGPVVSGTPGQSGLWHAVTGNGYTLGPALGRMMAEAVLNRDRLPDAFNL